MHSNRPQDANSVFIGSPGRDVRRDPRSDEQNIRLTNDTRIWVARGRKWNAVALLGHPGSNVDVLRLLGDSGKTAKQ